MNKNPIQVLIEGYRQLHSLLKESKKYKYNAIISLLITPIF
jgi:hypothetical protein